MGKDDSPCNECRVGTQADADVSEVFLGLLLAFVYLLPWSDPIIADQGPVTKLQLDI